MQQVHNVIRNDVCYVCTICGKAAGDGDGFVGMPCRGKKFRQIPKWEQSIHNSFTGKVETGLIMIAIASARSGMHSLGTFAGAPIYIETENKEAVDQARSYLNKLVIAQLSQSTNDIEVTFTKETGLSITDDVI